MTLAQIAVIRFEHGPLSAVRSELGHYVLHVVVNAQRETYAKKR